MGHLSALLKKNWILWKRGGCCSALEILFPVGFICFFFLFRSLIEENDVQARSYLERNIDPANKIMEQLPIPLFPDFPEQAKTLPLEAQRLMGPMMQNCIDNERFNNKQQNGHIALVPDNDITRELSSLFANYEYKTRFYESQEKLFEYITSQDYGEDVCIGVTIDEAAGNKYQYRLHYNTSLQQDDQIPDTNMDDMTTYKIQNIEDQLMPWAESGFLTIQNWIDNIIIKKITNNPNLDIKPHVTSEKVQEHKDDDMPNVVARQFATFTILPLIIVFLRFLQQLLVEKEKKIRESMRIMGLSDSSLYLSWIIHYSIVFAIIAFFTILICKSTVFPNSDFSLMFFWYYLYCLNIMFQALNVSVFFTNAKIGNIAGMVVYLGFYILVFVVTNNADMPIDQKTSYSIFPQVSVTLGSKVFGLIENKKDGISWSNWDLVVEKYNIARSFNMMIVSLVIFMLLFFYLDQVVPNEFGTKKHPCFCFTWLFNKAKKVLKGGEEEGIAQQNEENIEPVEAVLKEKEMNGEALVIKNLSKKYPNGKRAVNNLSLTMYKDHISCFLGHNGAGKTTTISMLTGMTSITDGSATAFGYDVESQMSELRHIMGVCPQHDILFDNLTCKEHLELIATFKGIKDKQKLQEEIDQMLNDVDLMFKKDALSKTLSGGQKRRLSVAMAFIGGSKLIYLDEPTSGCDTSVRRHIWDMLRRYKQDRIIILTTHFMDEADYLGDRISIIGDGKLICSGSSSFLKNKFGVGYNLTIVKEDTTVETQPIIDLVMKHIPEAKKVSDVSAELAFQLKMSDIDKFQGLFDELDGQKKGLRISNYGISITTMEEVFLKVAENDADELKNNSQLVRSSSLKRQGTFDQQEEQKKEQKKEQDDIDNFDLNKVRVTKPIEVFFTHFWALAWKRWHYFKRDRKGIFCEIVIPVGLLILALFTLNSDGFVDSPTLLLDASIYDDAQPVLYGGASGVSKSDIDAIKGKFPSDYEFEYSSKTDLKAFDEENYQKKSVERKGAYYFQDISANSVEYLVEVATLNKDAAPLYVNEMNEAILKQKSGNDQLKLEVYVHPFDFTAKFKSLQNTDKGIGSAFVFAMILSFVSCSLIAYVVKERAENIKH